MLVLVHQYVFLKVPVMLLSVVARVLELGFYFISLMVCVVWTEVVILEGSISLPIASALGGLDIHPALMGVCQGRDVLPNSDIVHREEGIRTMGSMANHLINLAGPCSWGHRVSSDGLVVPNNVNRNMSKSKGWTLQRSLLMLWMEKTGVNNQTKIDDDENLLKTL